jgi:hypothetical protein
VCHIRSRLALGGEQPVILEQPQRPHSDTGRENELDIYLTAMFEVGDYPRAKVTNNQSTSAAWALNAASSVLRDDTPAVPTAFRLAASGKLWGHANQPPLPRA